MHLRLRTCLLLLFAWPATALGSNGPAQTILGNKGPVALPANGDTYTAFRMPSSIGWNFEDQIDLDLFYFIGTSSNRNALNDIDSTGGTPGGAGGIVLVQGRPDPDDEVALEQVPDDLYDAYGYDPNHKLTFHTGFFVDLGGGDTDTEVRWTTYPEGIELGTGIRFLTFPFTVAYTPRPWISLGLALQLTYATLDIRALVGGDDDTSLGGSPLINGVPLPGNPTYADFLGLFASDDATDPTTLFESQLQAVMFGAILSLSLRPTPNLAFGFSYRPRSWTPFPFTGDAEVDATRTFSLALGGLTPTLQQLFLDTLPQRGTGGFVSDYDVELRGLRIPRQVRFSMAWWPVDQVVLGLEVAWIEWHRAFRQARIQLENGSNPDLNFVIGSTGLDAGLKQRWRNQWLFSAYVAWAVHEQVTLRMGWNYGRSPINEDTQGAAPSTGFVDLNMSLGGSYRIGNWEFHLLYEHGFHASRRSDDSPESLSAKFNYFSSRQHFIHAGFTYRF